MPADWTPPGYEDKPADSAPQLPAFIERCRIYTPAACQLARGLCLAGCSFPEVAQQIGVSPHTLRAWMRREPDFARAIWEGTVQANADLAASVYKHAMEDGDLGLKVLERRLRGWQKISQVAVAAGAGVKIVVDWEGPEKGGEE